MKLFGPLFAGLSASQAVESSHPINLLLLTGSLIPLCVKVTSCDRNTLKRYRY